MAVKCITVEITNRAQSGKDVKLEIKYPESDMVHLETNEWPIILNALGRSKLAEWRERTCGFQYTFGEFVFGE